MDDNTKKEMLLIAADALQSYGRIKSSATLRRHAGSLELDTSEIFSEQTQERPFGVSIILPTFKGAGRISRALDSLLDQTEDRANFEVVIVSNGPLDKTPDVVAEYQKHHSELQITFLRTKTAGASNARNIGLRHARFAYCTYLDDDDYISPQYISVLLQHAEPNRLVFAKIIDFDEAGQRPSPISDQVRQAVETEGSNHISRPFYVRSILSMTCAKLAPTACLLYFDFDVDLHSGEDVVFWTEVIVKHHLNLYVPEDIDEAVYYREVRQGSVSRRTDDFSFAVTERLEVLLRIQKMEGLVASTIDAECKTFLQSRYAGQSGFIISFLRKYKERYRDFLSECRRLCIREDIIKMVNDRLADTLVISYCFPPFNDTSAIVMTKRIIGWQWPVRVISNDMGDRRSRSAELYNVIVPYLASHVELKTSVSFAHERPIREFAEQSLKSFQAIPKTKTPSKIYSRSMWAASSFAAALIKVNNPHVMWTAEFSDPLVLDIHGEERKGDVPPDWLTSLGLLEAIEKLAPDHASTSQIFRLAELLPYILADEIVFTNEDQRHYMLSQPWLQTVRDRAMSISMICPHPSLPSEYYSMGRASVSVDMTKVNIGFFGSFYATRGLREVLVALKHISAQGVDGVVLHVVSSDASALVEEVNAFGISALVQVHPSLPYFDCLASFRSMDYLLVNDAVTAGIKPVNPYLPSKLSDYLGADQPIWALVEPGSSLSKANLPAGSIMSTLGDETEYSKTLVEMIRAKYTPQTVELAAL
ncbi:glycosyltransferase [Paracoccus actinidiae]|uniref:glycosyltransferase n=1 Tax=Paracoccus actinidiae TaxID=3064531 RepID=UPI0027D2E901|nr:glycosyltransferase [Paracoccus sp. M09]